MYKYAPLPRAEISADTIGCPSNNMRICLQATGKVWTKKQLQEQCKKMIAGEKKVGDAIVS